MKEAIEKAMNGIELLNETEDHALEIESVTMSGMLADLLLDIDTDFIECERIDESLEILAGIKETDSFGTLTSDTAEEITTLKEPHLDVAEINENQVKEANGVPVETERVIDAVKQGTVVY